MFGRILAAASLPSAAKTVFDAVGLQELLGQVPHRLIGTVSDEDVIARLEVAEQGHACCGEPRGQKARAIGSLKFTDRIFQGKAGGSAARTVAEDALLPAPGTHFTLLMGVLKHHRTGPNNGRIDGRATLIGR